MQRKGNTISEKIQTGNQETFGIDMGGTLWATAIRDWESGKNSYYGLKDKEKRKKQLLWLEGQRAIKQRGTSFSTGGGSCSRREKG